MGMRVAGFEPANHLGPVLKTSAVGRLATLAWWVVAMRVVAEGGAGGGAEWCGMVRSQETGLPCTREAWVGLSPVESACVQGKGKGRLPVACCDVVVGLHVYVHMHTYVHVRGVLSEIRN